MERAEKFERSQTDGGSGDKFLSGVCKAKRGRGGVKEEGKTSNIRAPGGGTGAYGRGIPISIYGKYKVERRQRGYSAVVAVA